MQEEGKKREKEKKKKRRSERASADGEVKMRKSAESRVEDVSEKPEAQEVLQEPSDVEEGGLDLNKSFKPVSAYMQDREEMLEQCFHVLGETKLKNMLPDELKECPLTEIKKLCWDQLQQLSDIHLLEILEAPEEKKNSTDGQQDSIVDSTSCLKETEEKQGSGSEEDSDVLSINADIDDSDIEGHKDVKPEEASLEAPPPTPPVQSSEPKVELQQDIDRSVSEILAPTPSVTKKDVTPAGPDRGRTEQPSAQQLELLELEMRARAIKALMKAGEMKKRV
ncbi:caspase activity and apoptosis inhibitor 1 isoform X2 [Triplophysa rosa]|uniref:caspase activity and apoptosis inhibitor 1 isoform X2 n=1 Tax=Triplophysa rosa TaxID=992332 RepID=UPI00254636CA|nr:caspase activity and apoptosis inhibitor 1 isoform X2 [Triplophysa rosa]